MAPLTKTIVQCLRTVCDRHEPKLGLRLSLLHLVGKFRMPVGGVLFCNVCSETIFSLVSQLVLKRLQVQLSLAQTNIFGD